MKYARRSYMGFSSGDRHPMLWVAVIDSVDVDYSASATFSWSSVDGDRIRQHLSRMSEKQATRTLMKAIKAYAADNALPVQLQRIETTTGPGVPDLSVAMGGVEYWLEGKYLKLPKRSGTRIKLFSGEYDRTRLTQQANWLIARRQCGNGRAWLWWKLDGHPKFKWGYASGTNFMVDPVTVQFFLESPDFHHFETSGELVGALFGERE